ncbi:MAG: hypothetical protein KAH84_09835 [Thiomargarita sp.]|nr:hypothetical protein [Thiomargarita sp.]
MPIFYKHPLARSKPKLVPVVMKIRQHNPWLCPISIVLIIIILTIVALLLWKNSIQALKENRHFIIKQQLVKIDKINQQFQNAQIEKAYLIDQNKKLNKQLTKIIATTQINQKNYAKVLQSLSQSQNKNQDLIEELTFYQRLLTTPKAMLDKKQGIKIASFELNVTEKVNYYTYKLILTQWTKDIKLAEGKIKIYLVGDMQEQIKGLNKITEKTIQILSYQFIYFQRFIGEFKLPAKFMPKNLTIHLITKQQVDKTHFKWKELIKRSY